jgi:kumamolisin
VEPAAYSYPFAERAGYDASVRGSVSDIVPATGSALVAVTFRPSDPSFFAPAPGAPRLTVAEIADEYGLSSSAYASAEAYFESMGLSVVHTEPDRLSLTVSGAPAALDRAFATELESGHYEGRDVTFPATSPSLPPALERSVAAVTGLSEGFVTFSLPSGLSEEASNLSTGPAQGENDLVTPAIARAIYDVSALYNVSAGPGSPEFAQGEGIVLLLWGWGYSPSDLSHFFANDYPSDFPAPHRHDYPVDNARPPADNATQDPSKGPQELTLDMEWAGSMAPGATLNAVYAPDGPEDQNYSPTIVSMTDALTEAVNDIPGVTVISMSFGTPESSSPALAAAWATDFAVANRTGITLLAATGDEGGVTGVDCQGTPTTDYPADSPDVLAVGGTEPTLDRSILGQITGFSESAWAGSGGGFASQYSAPYWQEVGSAAGPISKSGHRGVPDVSAAAAYDFLYYDGQDLVDGGTSFATPLWGGLIAEMDTLYGSSLGFLTPRLYAVGAAEETGKDLIGLADVSSGSTCIGTARAGWDPETGWGSPRALLLYEDLTATFVDLSVSASPSPVAPGGTVTVVAHLSNRSSGAPIAGVPITVTLMSSAPNGPCAGVWGTESPASNATGVVTFAVTIPVCFLGAHGTAAVSVTQDGYFGTNSTSFEVNIVGFFPGLAWIETYPANLFVFALIMGVAIAVGYALGRRPPRTSRGAPTTRPTSRTASRGGGPTTGSPTPPTPAGGNAPTGSSSSSTRESGSSQPPPDSGPAPPKTPST